MKLSAGVEWAVHCCVAMSRADGPVPAARLAEFHGISRTYLSKHLRSLAVAGVITAVEGRQGGYILTRPPAEISLCDIVDAIHGRSTIFVCTEIRKQGPMPASSEACKRPCGVAAAMRQAERAYRRALAATTIADLATQVEAENGPGSLEGVASWLRSG